MPSKLLPKSLSRPLSTSLPKSLPELLSTSLPKSLPELLSKSLPESLSKPLPKLLSELLSESLSKPLPRSLSELLSKPLSRSLSKPLPRSLWPSLLWSHAETCLASGLRQHAAAAWFGTCAPSGGIEPELTRREDRAVRTKKTGHQTSRSMAISSARQ